MPINSNPERQKDNSKPFHTFGIIKSNYLNRIFNPDNPGIKNKVQIKAGGFAGTTAGMYILPNRYQPDNLAWFDWLQYRGNDDLSNSNQ